MLYSETLMCLPGVSSDYMSPKCSKYDARPTSTADSIKDAVTHAFVASLGAYL